MTGVPGLRVHGVAVDIGDRRIVDGCSIDVAPGALVGVVGPNGSGKSTLLRAVYRALAPRTGVVRVGDDDVWALTPRAAARRIAVVGQDAAAEFDFTVLEVVAMGRLPHLRPLDRETRTDRQVCLDAIDRVGLRGYERRSMSTLSGGERQCVLVARALAQQAPVLVLDEPTNHLDVCFQHEVLTLVRDLGLTTLTALHDLDLANAYCDEVVVMSAGRIVAGGTPDEVFTESLVGDVFGVQLVSWRDPATGRRHLAFERLPAVAGDPVAATAGQRC